MATAAEYFRTGARTANLPGRRFDHVFFTSMALIMLATVFAGFAHTYYLAGLFRAPLPSRIIQIHGAVFTCWILLLVTQTSLVSGRRVDIHRRLGVAGFFSDVSRLFLVLWPQPMLWLGTRRRAGIRECFIFSTSVTCWSLAYWFISHSARAETRPRTGDSSTSRQLRCSVPRSHACRSSRIPELSRCNLAHRRFFAPPRCLRFMVYAPDSSGDTLGRRIPRAGVGDSSADRKNGGLALVRRLGATPRSVSSACGKAARSETVQPVRSQHHHSGILNPPIVTC